MIFLHDPQDRAINIRENEEKYRQATAEIHFQEETHTMYTTVFCQPRTLLLAHALHIPLTFNFYNVRELKFLFVFD